MSPQQSGQIQYDDEEAAMTVHELAEELRARCEAYLDRNPAKYPPEKIDTIRRQSRESADEQIINAYVTCNDCGQKWLDGAALSATIAAVNSAEQFLRAVPH